MRQTAVLEKLVPIVNGDVLRLFTRFEAVSHFQTFWTNLLDLRLHD